MNGEIINFHPVHTFAEQAIGAYAEQAIGEEKCAVLGPNCPVCGKARTRPVVAVLKTTEATRPAVNQEGQLVEVPTAIHKLLGPFSPPQEPMPPPDNLKLGWLALGAGVISVVLGIHSGRVSPAVELGLLLLVVGSLVIVLFRNYTKRYPALLAEWEEKDNAVRRLYFCPDGPHVFDPTTGDVAME